MTDAVKLRIISLGAGVQSTTMALMAARGELGPMPDCAIFADTGSEPRAVYDHLRWLMSGVLPFPVHMVSSGNLLTDVLAGTNSGGRKSFASIPFYMDRGKDGKIRRTKARRQCTREYKLAPIARKTRELLAVGRHSRITAGTVEVWIGISTDEAARMKPSRVLYAVNRWPLIEAGMSRADCLRWIEERGYQRPPKSACTFCPLRSNPDWIDLRDTDQKGFEDALSVDRALRDPASRKRLRANAYLHPACLPLDQIDFETVKRERRNDFVNECEGICGV